MARLEKGRSPGASRHIGALGVSALPLGLAAMSDIGTSCVFTATWMTLLGAGIGLVLPASMAIAMGASSVDRAGSGPGLFKRFARLAGPSESPSWALC